MICKCLLLLLPRIPLKGWKEDFKIKHINAKAFPSLKKRNGNNEWETMAINIWKLENGQM